MSDQRQFRRIAFREALEFEVDRFKDFMGSTACDLSSGGVRIRCEKFMPLGTSIRVKFQIAEAQVFILMGKIVWIQQEPFGGYYQLGVEFHKDDSNEFKRRRIHNFIEQY